MRYATCLIKEQWGNNLSKFVGVKLPGGVMLDGQKIKDEAIIEKAELYAELRSHWEAPPEFLIG
jgi:hypothetical protein